MAPAYPFFFLFSLARDWQWQHHLFKITKSLCPMSSKWTCQITWKHPVPVLITISIYSHCTLNVILTLYISHQTVIVFLFLFSWTVNPLEAQTVSFIFLSCLFHQSLAHNGHSLLFNERRKLCTTTCKRNRLSELGKWINTIMTLQAFVHTRTPFLPVSFPKLSGSPGPQPEEYGHRPPLSCCSVPSLTRMPTPSPILIIICRSSRSVFFQKSSLAAFTQENLFLLQIFVMIII